MNVGDEIKVKVLLVDDQGRIKLSRKAANEELGIKDPERPQGERPPREEGGDRGGDRPRRSGGGGGGRGRGGPRRED